MNLTVDVRIVGGKELVKSVNTAMKNMKTEIRREISVVGTEIKNDSMRNAPLDTRNLRSSHFTYMKGRKQPSVPSWAAHSKRYGKRDTQRMVQAFAYTVGTALHEVRSPYHVRIAVGTFYAAVTHETEPPNGFRHGNKKYLIEGVLKIESTIAARVAHRMWRKAGSV